MKRKYLIILILLIIAIILSSASIIMNTSIMKDQEGSNTETKEVTSEISITILSNNETEIRENGAG